VRCRRSIPSSRRSGPRSRGRRSSTGSPARKTFRRPFEAFCLAEDMLPYRARLVPDRAAESADLLLRLALRWRTRDASEAFRRRALLCAALRVVHNVLAADPGQAMSYLPAWREWLAAEDPLAEFRIACADLCQSVDDVAQQVRRGEDPYAETRESLEGVKQKLGQADQALSKIGVDSGKAHHEEILENMSRVFETPWQFRWYARPFFYREVIPQFDLLAEGRTERGLRELLGRGGVDRMTWIDGVQTLEEIALVRLARTAMAVALGKPPPALDDPFTGQPLAVRRDNGATVISAPLPERFRTHLTEPELFSWEVPR